jgi:hypothetical protein
MLNQMSIPVPRTRRKDALVATVSIEDLKLLQEFEDEIDIQDAWQIHNEPGENISWEQLKAELYI